ncbi:MAG: YHS domain protein [Boseongicola sp.]|nr:YHS domain protein [Boseongicola sp.]MDD9978817.1 YHS domain protein [Boseongicola sp.]
MLTRRNFLMASVAAVPAVALISAPAHAAEPPVYALNGIAINGYDPVAYFTESKPVEGSGDFTSEWDGAIIQFASAENKALFDGDPEKYAPKYGGYCAYAVSKGYTASTDPDAWSIYNDRLYLNYSKSVRALWSLNKSGHVASADANWPSVLSQ